MKKLFTKLICLALVFGIFQSASASSIHYSNSVCPTLDDVVFPGEVIVSDPDLSFSTLNDELSPENLILNYGINESDATPTFPDPDNCQTLFFTYEDIVINIDDASFNILRKWTVLDWLTGNLIEEFQVIRNNLDLLNEEYCSGIFEISLDPWSCTMFDIDPLSFLNPDYTYENVIMIPDPSEGFGQGVHPVTINGTVDSEDFICYTTLIIEDHTPPVAIANLGVQITLNEFCQANITAEVIDNGSNDGNCGDVFMSIEPSFFSIQDAGTTVTVTLTVVDEAGNSNIALTSVQILPCEGDLPFSCLSIVTVPGLDLMDVQLYAEDFLSPGSVNNGDLTLTIEDSEGNTYDNGFIPEGSGLSFLYELTDNVTGESCIGVIQPYFGNNPCSVLACRQSISATLSESGTVTLYPEDFLVAGQTCSDLILDIYDENSNLIGSGETVTLDQTGAYTYQVTNPEGNTCWATLNILDHTPCPLTLACNDHINVSMYAPANTIVPIATITPDMVLEGNYSGCDISNFHIELTESSGAGFYFEGTGSVEVNQEGLYNYSITDPEGITCWGTMTIENKLDCPQLSDVVFPEDLSMTIVGITPSNIFQQLVPELLIFNYGYTEEQVRPTWQQVGGCNNLSQSYNDFVFEFDDDSFKIFRDWAVVDWLNGNTIETTQLIENNITLGLICDFLPNSAEFGDCDSGHTMDDDVEWPDDIAIADYRIQPNDLVAYSQIDFTDSQPIIVNNSNIYTMDYVDILQQLAVNLITVSRVWTVSANNSPVATYNQILEIDITAFSSLVAVNTLTARPVEGVQLTNTDITNDIGVAYPTDIDNLSPTFDDDYRNGITIKDFVLIQQHILGISPLNDLQVLAADINNSNSVTASDLTQLNNVILGVGPGTNSDWFFIDAPDNGGTISPSKEYIAIKPGDVDDDADLGSPFTFQSGKLFLEDALINNGEMYESKIQYDGEDLIFGAEVHVYYDESLVTIESLEANVENAVLTYNIDIPGEIHFTLQNTQANGFSFSDENHINISYAANANGLLSQAIDNTQSRNSYVVGLDYELFSLGLEFVDEITTSTKDISDHSDLFKLYPNPASDYITFDFFNETPGNFRIDIYNISGQLVAEHINETNIDVSALHSGMHFYRLTQDGQTYAGRISIIK